MSLVEEFTEDLDFSWLQRDGMSSNFRYLWNSWDRRSRAADEAIKWLATRIMITGFAKSEQDTPPILYCGRDAFAAKYLPVHWSDIPPEGIRFESRRQRSLVAPGYTRATDGEPVFDLVSVNHLCGPYRACGTYYRLILPICAGGTTFLAVLSEPANLRPL